MNKHVDRFRLVRKELARVATLVDIAETRVAQTLGTLPLPVPGISPRIAEDVCMELAWISMESRP